MKKFLSKLSGGGFLLLICIIVFTSVVFGAIEASYENADDNNYQQGIVRYVSQPIDMINRFNIKWFDRIGYTTPSTAANKYARQRYSLVVNKGTGVSSVTGSGTYKFGTTYTTSGVALNGYTISNTPSGTMPANNHNVTVEATPNSYTITFKYNDGTSNSTTRSVTYTKAYGSLPSPSRTGYTLDGWYTSSSGGTKITSTSTLDSPSNKTLYAHWTINKYKLTLNKDSNIETVRCSSHTDINNIPYGASVTITCSVKSPVTGTASSSWYGQTSSVVGNVRYKQAIKTTYSFTKWSGNSTSTSATYTFTMPASNITYKANGTHSNQTVYVNKQQYKIKSQARVSGWTVAGRTFGTSAYGGNWSYWPGYVDNGKLQYDCEHWWDVTDDEDPYYNFPNMARSDLRVTSIAYDATITSISLEYGQYVDSHGANITVPEGKGAVAIIVSTSDSFNSDTISCTIKFNDGSSKNATCEAEPMTNGGGMYGDMLPRVWKYYTCLIDVPCTYDWVNI